MRLRACIRILILAVGAERVLLSQRSEWLALFQAALAQLRAGQVGQADAGFQQLANRYPTDPQLLTSIGAALDSTLHHEQATVWYRRSLAIDPNYVPALNDLGQNLVALNQLEPAISVLARAVAADAGNWQAVYKLAVVNLRLARYGEAATNFRWVKQASTDSGVREQAGLGEATALLKAKRYSEAIAVLQPETSGAQVSHLLLLGTAEALAGDLPSAIAVLQNAVKHFPQNEAAYYRLALVFSLGGRNKEANEVLAAGLKAVPHSPLLLYGQAIISESMGLYEQAIQLASESLAQKAGEPNVWGLIANANVRLGRMNDAIGAFRTAVQHNADTHVRVNYAECLMRAGRIDEASKLLDQLQHQQTADAEVVRGLGKLYRAQNNFAKAEPALKRAIELDPEDAEAHYALAETLRHLGRIDAAKKEYAAFEKTRNASRMVHQLEIASNPSE